MANGAVFTKVFNPTHPFVVERHDQDDGSITYEVMDMRPASYRMVCSTNDRDDVRILEQGKRPEHTAKSEAELIARALNLLFAKGGA